ncbi:hypothetical protein ACFX1Q_016574 [Malus domestica]
MSLDRRELVFPKDDARYLSHTLPFCWKMPLDTSTRWSGDCQMLDIVCKASKSMDAVIRKDSHLYPESLRNAAKEMAEKVSGYNNQFAEDIARKKRRASMSSATDELTQCLSDPPAPLATDVLEWWKVNSMRYPQLSLMALDFLAVQAVSVAPVLWQRRRNLQATILYAARQHANSPLHKVMAPEWDEIEVQNK